MAPMLAGTNQRLSGASKTSSAAPRSVFGAVRPIYRAAAPVPRAAVDEASAVTIAKAGAVQSSTSTSEVAPRMHNENDLNARHRQVLQHFPTALGIDDFIARVEVVLSGYGFTGDNSIAMTNLCRDEVTTVLKDKIEGVFGSSFNTNGLGAVLTCGVTGMGAGLSHSPICSGGRERYVFFAFPHIAIDSEGTIGAIARPGRAGRSCACGALAKCLGEFQAEGYSANCKVPGEHDPLDPEYSVLKHRLARRLRYERTDVSTLDLAKITAVAERTITNDLEYLIEKAIDTSKADYAVVTGVQVHNWATKLDSTGVPSLEFAAPTKVYVVVNGQKMHLDLAKVPTLSPRQLMMLSTSSSAQTNHDMDFAISHSTGSTLQEIPFTYLSKRLGGASVASPNWNADLNTFNGQANPVKPIWQQGVSTMVSKPAAPKPVPVEHKVVPVDSIDDEDTDATPALLSTEAPTSFQEISKGTYVTVSDSYAKAADADSGPLKTGRFGIVVKEDPGDYKPFKVKDLITGQKWWYMSTAIKAVTKEEATAAK